MDFLISACSSVVLMPSLAAMVANRFGMRRDTVSYALGGMACSSGVIAVDLARRLMQVPVNSDTERWLPSLHVILHASFLPTCMLSMLRSSN